jgi:hypothetical protein
LLPTRRRGAGESGRPLVPPLAARPAGSRIVGICRTATLPVLRLALDVAGSRPVQPVNARLIVKGIEVAA